MSDVGLFIAGSIVTTMVVAGLIALIYAAILDGRFEERSRTDVVEVPRDPDTPPGRG